MISLHLFSMLDSLPPINLYNINSVHLLIQTSHAYRTATECSKNNVKQFNSPVQTGHDPCYSMTHVIPRTGS